MVMDFYQGQRPSTSTKNIHHSNIDAQTGWSLPVDGSRQQQWELHVCWSTKVDCVTKPAITRQRWGRKRNEIRSDPWFIYAVHGAKRKRCTPKRKKTKTMAKVEEFENGHVVPDKFGCVNSRNGMLASFSVTFVSFSAVYTDPTIQQKVFTIIVMWSVLSCACFQTLLECDWCFHGNTWHMTNFGGLFALV